MNKEYTIYFTNWHFMRDGWITYSAASEEDAIKQFREDYCEDYEIMRIHD